MIPVELFPALLMALDLAAAVVYGCHGDWKRVVYWTAACVLTASVTA